MFFSMLVHNNTDAAVFLVGTISSCNGPKETTPNDLCTISPGETKTYPLYGPGRAFVAVAYALDDRREVGRIHHKGKTGHTYRWTVGEPGVKEVD